MYGAVWVVVGILALNALLVGVLLIVVAIQRVRRKWSQRRLETIWSLPQLPPSARSRRRRSRRLTHVALAATMVWALLALSGLRADRVITSALGAVVNGTQTSSEHPSGGVPEPTGDRADAQGDSSSPASSEGTSASADPSPSSSDTTTVGDQGAPSTVAAIPKSPTAIRLLWTRVRHADGYQIARSIDGARWVTIASTDRGVTTYTDAGLSSGTTYYYRVLAVTEGTTPPSSDVVSATTTIAPLSTTTLTAVSTSSTAIDLAWTDVDGETGYRIERSADGTSGWTTIATTGQDVTSSTDAGLSSGTTYYYRVFAINGDDESPPSDVASATTAPDQSPAPTQGDAPTTDTATADALADPGSAIEPAP